MIQSEAYFLFSLRIWSVVSSSWVTNGLWWLLTPVLYLLLNLYISSLTVIILKSRWIVSLVTYQSAFIRDLSVFDWKCRSISMLELLAVPHRSYRIEYGDILLCKSIRSSSIFISLWLIIITFFTGNINCLF